MATIKRNDESLVERVEVLYPNTDVIDSEPYYDNFTAIQNALGQQTNITTDPINLEQYHAIRADVQSTVLDHYYANKQHYQNIEFPSNSFSVPIQIQSRKIDGHIFNLTQIVQDIGYNKNHPFGVRSSTFTSDPNTKNVSALLNIVLKMGGAHGPLTNIWRSRIDNDYFQRWYLEKYRQRSASLTQQNIIEQATQNSRSRDYQSGLFIDNNKMSTNVYNNDKLYKYDDNDTTSSVSSYSSLNEVDFKHTPSSWNQQRPPSILKKSNQNSQAKHHVTIREHHQDENITSQQLNNNYNTQQVLSDYHQFIQKNPNLNNDLNPEIIQKPNPEQITYHQNISVRYLVPPTPPPPGPLIIREIRAPRGPSPPPLIIKQQDPPPRTPSPLILREVPPTPPPRQEPTVITKIIPSESQSSRRVIVEQSPPLPPKPQSIIIEKWLPYKQPPPRQVIYERVDQEPATSEFQANAVNIQQRQRRHSAEYEYSNAPHMPIPVNIQRRNSLDYLEREQISEQPTGTFDQLAWSTHQQILAMQQRGRERVQAHQQWAANQWQQHANLFLQYPTQLTTTTAPFIIQQQLPMTMNTASYVETQEYRQRILYNPTFVYPLF